MNLNFLLWKFSLRKQTPVFESKDTFYANKPKNFENCFFKKGEICFGTKIMTLRFITCVAKNCTQYISLFITLP